MNGLDQKCSTLRSPIPDDGLHDICAMQNKAAAGRLCGRETKQLKR